VTNKKTCSKTGKNIVDRVKPINGFGQWGKGLKSELKIGGRRNMLWPGTPRKRQGKKHRTAWPAEQGAKKKWVT